MIVILGILGIVVTIVILVVISVVLTVTVISIRMISSTIQTNLAPHMAPFQRKVEPRGAFLKFHASLEKRRRCNICPELRARGSGQWIIKR